MAKRETVEIGSYTVAKNGKTKLIKFEAKPNADQKTKKLVADLIALLGRDFVYVNLYDPDFREKYNIPAFAKGKIAVEVGEADEPKQQSSKASTRRNDDDGDDEVNF